MAIEFQWDENKAKINSEKHGVTFQEAKTVFYDEFADQFFDQENSDDEDRFLLLGRSIHSRVLMVCHCYREFDEVIRIISARKATKSETKFYRGK
ncbi:MAG: BrnT family toxin [Chlorobium sp.]|nr:MAG: BrnT family toxin [Chlorobium sp.]